MGQALREGSMIMGNAVALMSEGREFQWDGVPDRQGDGVIKLILGVHYRFCNSFV